jgi:hypothetical protein
LKRILAVAVAAGAALVMSASSSSAAGQLCVEYDINVNGTQQAGAQCVDTP